LQEEHEHGHRRAGHDRGRQDLTPGNLVAAAKQGDRDRHGLMILPDGERQREEELGAITSARILRRPAPSTSAASSMSGGSCLKKPTNNQMVRGIANVM
jgi:hypothetical protein